MSDIENASFLGKRVGDMSREELLECVDYLSTRLQEYQTPEMAYAIGVGKAAAFCLTGKSFK